MAALTIMIIVPTILLLLHAFIITRPPEGAGPRKKGLEVMVNAPVPHIFPFATNTTSLYWIKHDQKIPGYVYQEALGL